MLRVESAKWVIIVLLDQLHKFHVLQVKRVQHHDLKHLIPIARQFTNALLKPQLRLLSMMLTVEISVEPDTIAPKVAVGP